ncbi:SIR2-like domain-containing protein [Burkholderia sp. WP9]|uniref:SIR2 family protein n=1 Tax=Burkholderia sp. WP9 TaxID=1500263 RepID=UPI000894AB40|nr:SIR2 family protein [Burkholderia sp. WP9]SED49418.1 SIR2-like domain-containing protein [Burkholderia sp. WP9]
MASFLQENVKTLVHLRRRLHQDNMLALCLGAGVSADFKFPMWKELVVSIAAHSEVNAPHLAVTPEGLAIQAQLLYQQFRRNKVAAAVAAGSTAAEARRAAASSWLHIVHECLYERATVDDEGLRQHPYLWDLLPLIKKSSMTINYNFDDSVERLLYLYNGETRAGGDDRGFEVVWKPSTQFRRHKGVIYHPNGFLPHRLSDGFSEDIVFMEQDFADQLIDVADGHYASLLNHFSKQTVVFVGLSVSDTSLKHVLRTSARNNPGHFHYVVHWCKDEKPTPEYQQALSEANFSLYNLVTLFFTTSEMREFSKLLVADSEVFNARCDDEQDGVRTRFRYYLTGPVGAGKSTMLEYIRCLDSFDEWVDRKNPLLVIPQEELTDEQRADVDKWINLQFRKKNRRISEVRQGISLIDRSPIDPLYFSADESAKGKRAEELVTAMVPVGGNVTSIAPGHLIMLTCDPAVLQPRLKVREKRYSLDQLRSHIAKVNSLWSESCSVTVIDTTHMTITEVVKRILEVILFEKYEEVSFQAICKAAAPPAEVLSSVASIQPSGTPS